ncbi:MAG: LuxR C-terminal-related transcriptional regulator [bacterium]
MNAINMSDGGSAAACLTKRERQILDLLIEGEPNKAIAARIGISERCVKWHLTNLYRKLSVECRTGAVASALRLLVLVATMGQTIAAST